MRLQKLFVLGMGLAVIGAMPALADQSRGGGGQRGQATGAMQGTVQQDRLHDQMRDRDRLYDRDQNRDRLRDRDQIYGSQLMTAAEKSAYRKKMRSLKTEQERAAYRQQHHEEMQKRAQARGVTLPDVPQRNRVQSQTGNNGAVQQRSQQRIEQQERNEQENQQIQQRQRTEQREQQDQGQ